MKTLHENRHQYLPMQEVDFNHLLECYTLSVREKIYLLDLRS